MQIEILFQTIKTAIYKPYVAEIPFQTSSSCLFKATALRRYLFLFYYLLGEPVEKGGRRSEALAALGIAHLCRHVEEQLQRVGSLPPPPIPAAAGQAG